MSPALVPSNAELQCWRKLAVAGLAASARKPRSGDEFERAGERAHRARFPSQAPGVVAECRRLLGFSREWRRMDFEHREANGDPVRRLAELVLVHVTNAEAPPPPRPFRADIDG